VVAVIQKKIGGAHGALVTAVSLPAFKQALGTLRRGGTCVLNGLPPGEFPVSIFDLVLNGQTVRGSIVGTRKDLEEALQFAADGKVKATIEEQALGSINDIFDRLKKGKVNGRIVLDIAGKSGAKKSAGPSLAKTHAVA
jgi:propanol-preferring alcohol dehydrogenase